MRTLILSLSVVFSFLLLGNTSCIEVGSQGNSIIVKQNRSVEEFSEIKFALSGELVLTQADSFAVIIEASENDIDKIVSEVKNGKLIIKSNKNIKSSKKIKIYVYAPNLKQIELAGSGNIYQENPWDFENIILNISGSGNISFENAVIKGDLENIIGGSGNINLTEITDVKNITNKIKGSGNINISSKTNCETNKIYILGSGNVSAFDVLADKGIVEIKGSGDVKITAISHLTIDIIGSGDVHFKGNPKVVSSKKGSGDICKVK